MMRRGGLNAHDAAWQEFYAEWRSAQGAPRQVPTPTPVRLETDAEREWRQCEYAAWGKEKNEKQAAVQVKADKWKAAGLSTRAAWVLVNADCAGPANIIAKGHNFFRAMGNCGKLTTREIGSYVGLIW